MTREQRAFGFERRPFEDATERSVDYGQRDVYGSGRQSEYARDYGLRDSGAGSFPRSWEGPWQPSRSYERNWRIQAIVSDAGKAWICVAPEPGCGPSSESPSQEATNQKQPPQWQLFAE